MPVSEGLEHADLPDGTGEFLDAWLMLVEKMVNPSTVLDSPHSLPAKMPGVTPSVPQFSALRFLIVTQKVSVHVSLLLVFITALVIVLKTGATITIIYSVDVSSSSLHCKPTALFTIMFGRKQL